jgi:hypothetical protein
VNDQRSTTEQLRDLIGIANERGLYDAADFCRREVERVDARMRTRLDSWPPPGSEHLAGRLDAAVTDAAGVGR